MKGSKNLNKLNQLSMARRVCAGSLAETSQFGLPQAHFRLSSHPTQFDMTHSSANDIAALPPGVKLATLDNGLVIIVRRSPLLHYGAVVELQP